MIWVTVNAVDHITSGPGGNIDFTPYNRFDSRFFRSFIKIDATIHNPMVSNCDSSLTKRFNMVHQSVDSARTVQKTVFRMEVEMHKLMTFDLCWTQNNSSRFL